MSWYTNIFKLKCVEPIKRKHGKTYSEWISHRFPIKNGITWRDAMIYDISQQKNPFYEELLKNARY